MRIPVNKNIFLLSLAFLFIFLGFDAVHQHLTTFFAEQNLVNIGFYSLIITYFFFLITDPLAAIIVSSYGPKMSMIIGALTYFAFILSLLSAHKGLIFLASAVLGIGAALLWTAQNIYLIKASLSLNYGENAGFFTALRSFGAALGILLLSFFISRFSFNLSFLVCSLFPLIGIFFLINLKKTKKLAIQNHFHLLKRTLTNRTALQLSSLCFATIFIHGLVLGIIPLKISEKLGVIYVGRLAFLFPTMPIFLSYFLGKATDIKGRKIAIIISYALIFTALLVFYFGNSVVNFVSGIILLAVAYSILNPAAMALVGDVSTQKTLDYLTALFWMMRIAGMLSALLISSVIKSDQVYLVSIGVLSLSLLALSPLFKQSLRQTKLNISRQLVER